MCTAFFGLKTQMQILTIISEDKDQSGGFHLNDSELKT
jgi:hypothetical protein